MGMTTALSEETAQARAAWWWEKVQSRDPFPHTLAKTASFLKNGTYVWFKSKLAFFYLSSLSLCLTLPRAKLTLKACSNFACVADQEPAPSKALFLNKQELSPVGLWDTFLGLHGAGCIKLYHSSTVWILSSDYQLFEYSKWVLPSALIHHHSSLVSVSSLSE